jgi:hypothetical protein
MSKEQTVGAFLKEKMTNMAVWVSTELGPGVTTVDMKQYVSERTETEIAYVAGLLSTNLNLIAHRDWSGLARLQELPPQLETLFHHIRQREDMHDKFWRYMELFAQVISN